MIKVLPTKKVSEKLSAKSKNKSWADETVTSIREFREGKKELVVHTKQSQS